MPDIDSQLRRLVASRAGDRCEYCLLSQDDAFSRHQIDHIISRKHGGTDDEANLALACLACNAWKGSDIAAFDPANGEITALFNPRRHRWEQHFQLAGAVVLPLSAMVRATSRLLKLNSAERIAQRRLLMSLGRYP